MCGSVRTRPDTSAEPDIQVIEVNRPDRSRRRRKDKSDPIDAESVARAVLAGEGAAVAIKARTQATNQLLALICELHDALRHQLDQRRLARRAQACPALGPIDETHLALSALGRRWLQLDDEVRLLHQHITTVVNIAATVLLTRPGIGPSPPPSCWSPRAATHTGCATRPASPPSAAPARSRTPAGKPNVTASTRTTTTQPMQPS